MLPFGDDRLRAAPNPVIRFAAVELDQAGEVAFEAKPKGSLGHQRGEPNYPTNISLNPVMIALVL